jgi:hypothetical protein
MLGGGQGEDQNDLIYDENGILIEDGGDGMQF